MTAFTARRVTRKIHLVNLDADCGAGLAKLTMDGPPMSFPKIAAVSLLSLLVSIGACDKKSDASADSIGPAAPGELRVVAGEHGFAPPSLSIPKGPPGSTATVNFVRTTDQTCATEVVFPDLNIKKPLPLNQVVPVNVPSDAGRSLAFQCGMGMYKGALLVK